MSYSDFKTIDQAVSTLELTVEDIPHFFSQVAPIEPSQRLKKMLDETLDLAASISTEKARSELIITPILLEVRRIFPNRIGYFSGNTFNVDESKGLTGACDFILSASSNQSLVTAPVLTLVEAKDNDIRIGLGQCVAQMVAAQIFNARKGPCIQYSLKAIESASKSSLFFSNTSKILLLAKCKKYSSSSIDIVCQW